jgi:Fe-S-cluster-containing hydrogenase component 2
MPTITYLVMIYALAGVDCIDVAADPAVVTAARTGLRWAAALHAGCDQHANSRPPFPWIMVSLNDSQDPHFRKAFFPPSQCPSDCEKPCEQVCPTHAIVFSDLTDSGVMENLCYGCGRCIPICPVGNIAAQSYQVHPKTISQDTWAMIDAVEIHTHVGNRLEFRQLWQQLSNRLKDLKLVSISCPDSDGVIEYLNDLYEIMAPLSIPIIWQTDGRPMSGDLGKGTTHAAIRLAQKVLAANLPGFVQLAGGTNHYTVEKLQKLKFLARIPSLQQSIHYPEEGAALQPQPQFAGIAYGSYARQLIMPYLEVLDRSQTSQEGPAQTGLGKRLGNSSGQPSQPPFQVGEGEFVPKMIEQALIEAKTLVSQLKYT